MFKNNVGSIDRIARVVLGLGVISLAFVGPQTPFAWAGLIFVGTGLAGTCPIYSLVGLSTCKVPSKG